MSLYVLPPATPDFTITAGSPSLASVSPGGSASYAITLGRLNNYTYSPFPITRRTYARVGINTGPSSLNSISVSPASIAAAA